ncbi:aldehyde dehydrogenase family protein [Micromonospora endophytica]|uniref:Aldehyde dehydrogenase n=1 Tax=Micromonospora endophytica TaxID=515350 RepID=A0A2W2C7T3_9ACTN|nr:aldehyde dehydrogenase family protein [Micromonospora endophytica]PZF95401.1 aldehyde dehydrogenase [Micromonospora endophytica]RIW50918.1 aldehyde dehydrogenase family protein [Micromonospora endophytica]BCJ60555.1 aldehyde dehydrogenase [Micromonospora endophytica]
MTAVQLPGSPVIEGDRLISTNPATGDEAGRVPVTDPTDVVRVVERARAAGRWWAELGFDGRRDRLLRWRRLLAQRMEQLAELVHAEGGKPIPDALVEIVTAVEHVDWAARNARRVLGPRRVRSRLVLAEFSAHLEYQPYGVVGVIGPWNYPVFTPIGSAAYALAAGNTVVFKPSEYTPVVGQWLVDTFAEVVPEQQVFTTVHGLGDVGAALCRARIDKLAFTGSTATAKKVMAACAESLTPVLVEAGGKDAMIVDADADLDAAAEACVWGGMTNAGQTCIGIERVYVVEPVFDAFLDKVVTRAGRLTVGARDADIGPITMPTQLDVIRRHIEDAVARGGRAALGGPDAVQPPYAYPTVLVDVPEDAAAVREETFGPTLTVNRVRDADEAVARANALPYGLGGSVFGRRRAAAIAGRLRSGMASVNSTLTFAGMSTLPFGGVGESGFGRIHGEDGLREFARAKAVTRRRARSLLRSTTFERTPADVARLVRAVKMLYGR